MLAAKVKETFPDGGTVVVIQLQGQLNHLEDVCEAQIRGIRRQLEDEVKWPLHRTGPVFEFTQQGIDTEQGFTYDACAKWLEGVTNPVAVISFLGLPDPNVKPTTEEGQKKHPPYCALMPGQKENARWGRNIETLAVAAHKKGINPMDIPKRSASEKDVFDMRFEWVKE